VLPYRLAEPRDVTIRIIGGRWGGRRIETPRGDATRPATDAFRGRLINILGPDLTGVRVLDLFAGSGAFGLECLSRGAEIAVMVEKARDAVLTIRRNIEALAPSDDAAVLVPGDVYRLPEAAKARAPFDVVVVAPPYPHFVAERARLTETLASLPALLAADAVVVVQSDAGGFASFRVPGLEVYDARRMGRTDFTFLRAGS
jgi:16S rRNA (guanine966-N2)-methyltransferase